MYFDEWKNQREPQTRALMIPRVDPIGRTEGRQHMF